MGLVIQDEVTVAAILRLAEITDKSAEDAVRQAVDSEMARAIEAARRRVAIQEIQERFARLPKSGLKADKAFFDDLGGGL